MKRTLATFVTIVVAAAILSFAAATPVAAQGEQCLSDYDIQAQIESGQIKSWATIKNLAGVPKGTKDGDLKVCMRGSQLYYYVNVVFPGGAARKLILNAVDASP